MNYKISIATPFIGFFALMTMFMFMCKDIFFNINNYKLLLLLTVVSGVACVITQINKKRMKANLWSWRWIILAIMAVLASNVILEKPSEPFYIAYICLLLLLLLTASVIVLNSKQMLFLVDSYIASTIVMSLIILIQHKTPYAVYGIFRYALYFSTSSYYDVNFNALYFLTSSLLSYRLLQYAPQKKRWFYLTAIVLGLLTIMFLGSRGSFLPAAGVIVIAVMKDRNISLWKIAAVIIFLVAVIYFLPDDVYIRLIGTDYLSTESKRYIDWGYGWKAFSDHWLVGNGMISPMDIVSHYYVREYTTYTIHNTYLVYLAQLGVLGSIPFFAILIYPLYYFVKDKNWYLSISHLGFLFSIFMLEANYTYVLFVPMTVVYALIAYDNCYLEGKDDVLQSLTSPALH